MGTWYVTHSTLPLWKSKKDVSINYTLRPRASTNQPLQFDDVVQYRSASARPDSTPQRVIGVDSLHQPANNSSRSESSPAHPPPTHFKWRGKGWLMIASSRWQILGLGGGDSSAWAVTFFEKTLFTPAGLDIYSRSSEGLLPSLLEDIVSKIQALGGDVGRLAEQFFEVTRSSSDV
ncbi:hypothetical protein CERSUDRAFT_83232 [Gelatoporia subvermispora B]|uniref:Uncharacterized protein n=1 Tax=Ceriporiopsis subvermispora (strain B) TaxID=914234 RepID=M2PM92_CERS8|nr:hypothetical protein CERSUDRAFT_83232 [Gelatoporia subvermispora B]